MRILYHFVANSILCVQFQSSLMELGMDEPSPSTSFDHGDLYAAYVEFMWDARDAILPLEPNEQCRQQFLQIHQAMTRTEFEQCLDHLSGTPERLQRFRTLIERGFQKVV